MNLHYYILFWICITGLCLGSFFNVVILRSLSDESIVFPASKCPKCGHKLYAWHNIPVISYILLRGKCYFCKEKISLQYPVVEIITMLLFGLTYLKFGISIIALFILIWISCLIIMTVTDLREKVADCNIAIFMGICGILFWIITAGWHGLLFSIAGGFAGALIVEIIARLGYLFAKGRAMGEADTYVAGAIGAITGITGILPALVYSLIASMVFVIPVFLYNRFKDNDKLTCILFVLFTISAVYFKTVNQNYLSLITLALLGIALGYSTMRKLKDGGNKNYLPYIPALSAGLLYYIFI